MTLKKKNKQNIKVSKLYIGTKDVKILYDIKSVKVLIFLL